MQTATPSLWRTFYAWVVSIHVGADVLSCPVERSSTRLFPAEINVPDYFLSEEPENQRNFTGVSPELMFECVILRSGLIMYAIPGC